MSSLSLKQKVFPVEVGLVLGVSVGLIFGERKKGIEFLLPYLPFTHDTGKRK